jgi:hypothetical protein
MLDIERLLTQEEVTACRVIYNDPNRRRSFAEIAKEAVIDPAIDRINRTHGGEDIVPLFLAYAVEYWLGVENQKAGVIKNEPILEAEGDNSCTACGYDPSKGIDTHNPHAHEDMKDPRTIRHLKEGKHNIRYYDPYPSLKGSAWEEIMSKQGHDVTAHLGEVEICPMCKMMYIIEQLGLMQDAYSEKRSDVSDAIDEILRGEPFDPSIPEHRFADFIIKLPQFQIDEVEVRYDTLTTMLRVIRKDDIEIWDDPIDGKYSD